MSSDDLRFVKATSLDDLWEGDFVEAEIEGEQVIILHLSGGRLRAYPRIRKSCWPTARSISTQGRSPARPMNGNSAWTPGGASIPPAAGSINIR